MESSLLEEIAIEMMFSNLVHLKSLLMVLTAAAGTVAGGTMVNSYVGQRASQSFVLDVSPTFTSIGQNATATATVTVMSLNGYSGAVGLSVYMQGQRLATTLNPTSVNVPSNGMAKSNLTVSASNTIGNHTIVVIGLAGSHGRTLYSSAILRVQVGSNQDFTITSNPSIIVNPRGSSNTTMITAISNSGYAGNVSLTVTAPFGYITVTGSQNPLTLTPGGTATSTLVIATSSSATLGSYTITVTGTAGSRMHTATITLTVIDPIPPPVVIEKLAMNTYQFINNTDLVLTLQNTGNTSTTLASYTVRDSSGDSWTLAAWPGPTIAPGASSTATILIGNNCPGCTYTGILGLFPQFISGQTYTVTVTSAAGTFFPFPVKR